MAEIKIAAVKRAGVYSPNHIGNDTAILNIVSEQLRKRGCEVSVYSEEQLCAGAVSEPVVLNMCREQASIKTLQRMEDDGRLVINSGYGIENCTRERMTRILVGSGIPFPKSITVGTDEAVRQRLNDAGMNKCWIKRGDYYTMHKEDVSYVRHPEEAQEVLQEYFLRGIKRAVISRHLEGDLIKFYGIAGTGFFYWFYPFVNDHSKYGYERVNGSARGTEFDIASLRAICGKAAETLDVMIYGGDCVVAPDGTIRIIDFNDWPSFAPCRTDAATHIAKAVMAAIRQHTESKRPER